MTEHCGDTAKLLTSYSGVLFYSERSHNYLLLAFHREFLPKTLRLLPNINKVLIIFCQKKLTNTGNTRPLMNQSNRSISVCKPLGCTVIIVIAFLVNSIDFNGLSFADLV